MTIESQETRTLNIRNGTNIVRRTYICFCTLSIGGRLATGGSRDYNIYHPFLNITRIGRYYLTNRDNKGNKFITTPRGRRPNGRH